jgi:hypothetical protein
MIDETSPKEIARRARLKAALRENLKRRKSQAKGRAAGAIVTPDDEPRGSVSHSGSASNDDTTN